MALSSPTPKATFAIAYKTNSIGLLKLSDLLPDPTKAPSTVSKVPHVTFLDDGYHLGRVSDETDPTRTLYTTMDMDIAVHRPLLVTCCKSDSTLRIWNYLTLECEMAKCLTVQQSGKTAEPVRPLSVAFHPSGYFLACGFDTQAIVWHLLLDELRPYYVFSHYKHCAKVRFSHGGQYLAIAQLFSTYKSVFVHHTYSLQCLHTIKVPSNCVVCELVFSQDDSLLALCCTDGILLVYSFVTQSETLTHSSRRCVYSACVLNAPDDVLAFGADEARRGIVRRIIKDEIVEAVLSGGSKFMTAQFFSPSDFAVGTENGLLQFYHYPDTKKEYLELNIHSGPVSKVMLAPNGRFAFSCGEDGTVVVYAVRVKNAQGQEEDKKAEGLVALDVVKGVGGVVLVEKDRTRADQLRLEKLQQKIHELERERRALEDRFAEELKQRLADLEEDKKNAVKETETQLKLLRDDFMKKEQLSSDAMKRLEASHQAAIADLETVFKSKLDRERKTYLNLEQRFREDIGRLQETLDRQEKEKQKEQQQDHERYGRELEKLRQKLQEVKEGLATTERRQEDKLLLQEDEHEQEMDLREIQLHKGIAELTKDLNAKDEELKARDKIIREIESERADITQRNQGLLYTQDQLQAQVTKLQSELKKAQTERQLSLEETSTLKAKLLKIKAKHKAGIKEKQALVDLAKGLKDKIAPAIDDNAKLKTRVKEIQDEYQEYITIMEEQRAATVRQTAIATQLRETLAEKEKQIKVLEDKLRDVSDTVFHYKVKGNVDKKAYTELFYELYAKYVSKEEGGYTKKSDVTAELDQQIKYLHGKNLSQETGSTLKKQQLDKMCQLLRAENSRLLNELNDAIAKLRESDKARGALEARVRILAAQAKVQSPLSIPRLH